MRLLCSFLLLVILCTEWIHCQAPPNSVCYEVDGRTFYLVSTSKSYNQAKSFCQSHSMRLARVYNSNQNTFFYSKTGATHSNKWWIGLSDSVTEGTFKWEDGSIVTYNAWGSGEPNNAGGNEDCTEYGHFSQGKWNDVPCSLSRKFICESDKKYCVAPPKPITSASASCEAYGGRSYYFVSNSRSYSQAKQFCVDHEMKTNRVYNASHNTFLYTKTGSTSSNKWWIGLTDIAVEGSFKWEDGQGVSSYNAWGSGEPNNAGGNEDCTEYGHFSQGKWNDVPCSLSRKFICESGYGECIVKPDAIATAESVCHEYQGHTYYFVRQAKSYSQAKQFCQQHKMKMTHVYTNAHNNFLYAKTGSTSSNKWWIGLTDSVSEGTFKWDDGSALTYRKWGSGEPNNAGGNEDCTEYGHFSQGKWNDVPCSLSRKFICESRYRHCVSPPAPPNSVCHVYGGRTYFLVSSAKSYSAAKQFCQQYFMKLAHVYNLEHNTFLYTKTGATSSNKWWIGLSDSVTEGTFKWDDGSALSYNAWASGEPNNAGGNEDCTEYGHFSQGKWNDVPCSLSRKFICESARNQC